MREEISRWTEQLVQDPASLAFVPLVDALRRARRLDEARRVALTGLERHPYNADAHDALARVYADGGDIQRARDEWEMALHLQPQHLSALRGLGFLSYRAGDLAAAERHLLRAQALEPNDHALGVALERVRKAGARPDRPSPAPNGSSASAPNGSSAAAPNGNGSTAPDAAARSLAEPAPGAVATSRELFASVLGQSECTALLLDPDGLVLAGAYVDSAGRDVAEEIGAELSGVSEEAARALGPLGLGHWTAVVIEAEHATVALAPARDQAVVMIAAARETQIGLVRRLLTQATARAAQWLAAGS